MTLKAFDLAVAAEVDGWWTELPDLDRPICYPPTFIDNHAFVTDGSSNYSVDIETFTVNWQGEARRRQVAPAWSFGDIYLSPTIHRGANGSGVAVDAYSAEDGALSWSQVLGSFGHGTIDHAAESNGVLVLAVGGWASHGPIGGWDLVSKGFGDIVALDLSSGQVLWAFRDVNAQTMACSGDMLLIAGAIKHPFENFMASVDIRTGDIESFVTLTDNPGRWIQRRLFPGRTGCYLSTAAGIMHSSLTSWQSRDFSKDWLPGAGWLCPTPNQRSG